MSPPPGLILHQPLIKGFQQKNLHHSPWFFCGLWKYSNPDPHQLYAGPDPTKNRENTKKFQTFFPVKNNMLQKNTYYALYEIAIYVR